MQTNYIVATYIFLNLQQHIWKI